MMFKKMIQGMMHSVRIGIDKDLHEHDLDNGGIYLPDRPAIR
jgi:hypothetical protein